MGSDVSPQRDAQEFSGILNDRGGSVDPVRFYEFDRFRLDTRKHLLMRDGRPIAIQPKALDTLLVLVRQRGRVVAREELIRWLWPDSIVEEANLSQNVFVARKALGESAHDHRFIVTVARQGYRFVGDVRELTEGDEEPGTAGQERSAHASAVDERRPAGLRGQTGCERPPDDRGTLRERLAVLPFANLSGDPGRDYLAEGLADETIATLGQIDPTGLVVIGRTSMAAYKHTTKSLAEIGAELDADYLLESSVRVEHDRVRVTTGLVHARDQLQIWSRSYECDVTSVLELQKELGAGIAQQVRSWLSPCVVSAGRRHTASDAAHDSYLRGRFAQRQRTPAANTAAVRLFEEATALDPEFALAWAALAEVHASSGINGDGAPKVIAPPARHAAARAVALDPQLAEALTSIARVRFWLDWDWTAAEAALDRAVRLDPGNADSWRMLAFVASNHGRHADARAAAEQAADRDPLSPISHGVESEAAFRRRDFDTAVTHAARSLDLDPTLWIGRMLAAQAYEQKREYDRALDMLTDAQRLSANNSKTISLRGYILGRIGLVQEAGDCIEQLARRAATAYVPPYATALIHAGLGDRDATLEWLEHAYMARDVHLTLLSIDPKWDRYRGDPTFESLLSRCAFPA